MRKVLKGMEKATTMLSYNPWPGEFEIIAIYPPENENMCHSEHTVIKAPATQIISLQEYKNRRK